MAWARDDSAMTAPGWFRNGLMIAVTLCTSSPAFAQLRAPLFVSGLNAPVAFVQDPSDAGIQYVVEQAGRIRVVRNGVVESTPFLDVSASILSGGERGLLGIAFPPNYGSTGSFYVNFTRAPDGHTVVARFRRSSN